MAIQIRARSERPMIPKTAQITAFLLWSAVLMLTPGCVRKNVHVAAAVTSPTNNAYKDLVPGERLRIVAPVLKSGRYQAGTTSTQTEGNTIVLSAPDLAGYEVSNYSVTGGADGKVRLRFTSAEITREGKTAPEAHAPRLPFALPSKAQHVRLIYLVRNSRSDHNMAITASRAMDDLNRLTSQLKDNPDLCKSDGKVFCSWVPAGIAVRPETVGQ